MIRLFLIVRYLLIISKSITNANGRDFQREVNQLPKANDSSKSLIERVDNDIIDTINSTSNILSDGQEEPKRASFSDLLQCCLLVLVMMLILMLLSDWTDLSVLLQTSRHHMVIIEM